MHPRESLPIKKVTIITPCFNAEAYIEETVRSVLTNTAIKTGRASLEYIVCDGGSTDATLTRLDPLIKASGSNVDFRIISEPDSGIYDALSKGLLAGNGDIYAYLNAGDYYSPHAIEIALSLFEKEHVKWLTGMGVKYNENSHLVHVLVPYRYRRRLIRAGLYGTKLPYIQQESTFWKSELNGLLDHDKLKRFGFAGDYYLWKTFASSAEFYIVEAWLGGFRHHDGQLSQSRSLYLEELRSIVNAPSIGDYLISAIDFFCWHFLPPKMKKRLNPKTLFTFDHKKQAYT